MSAIDGFYMGYWRPNDSLLDAWSDYVRDNTRATMTAEKVGKYLERFSEKQISAISEATSILSGQNNTMIELIGVSNQIQRTANRLLSGIREDLSFLNRKMDIQIEQQRLMNIKLDNIIELLKIPNSEKERQQAITLGIKFFVNAAKDEDLFQDALDNFLKAEQMLPQDYFVLHRIGCIYMYVPKFIDVKKACVYFDKAAKYAAVESDPDAIRFANLLINDLNKEYTQSKTNINSIEMLAADSYNKAALAYYVLGDDEIAINRQEKAVRYNPTAPNLFTQSKYMCRKGCDNNEIISLLNKAISKDADIINAIQYDIDMLNNPCILRFLEFKMEETNNILDEMMMEEDVFKSSVSFKNKVTSNLSKKINYLNNYYYDR